MTREELASEGAWKAIAPRGDLGVIAERIADFAAAAEGSRKKINFIRLLRAREL